MAVVTIQVPLSLKFILNKYIWINILPFKIMVQLEVLFLAMETGEKRLLFLLFCCFTFDMRSNIRCNRIYNRTDPTAQ